MKWAFPADLKVELKRKVFHSFSLFYALGYLLLERRLILSLLAALLLLETFLEFVRFLRPSLNVKLLKMFGGIHRPEEERKFSGIFWTLLGSLVTMALFQDRSVVLCAMGFLIFGDAAAALFGKAFGRHKVGAKSLEGSLACFLACFAVGVGFFDFRLAFAAAFFATVIELLPLPLNDNFWFPVLSAAFITWIH